MKTHISESPAQDAGVYIQNLLQVHSHTSILFLIGGGSSLSVLEYIEPEVLGKHITVCTTDERFTREDKGNNFLQLQQTNFFKRGEAEGMKSISTYPQEGETHTQFSERIQGELESYYKKNPQGYTLGLFGIGEDGHTASIFPSPESEFLTTYVTDSLYVPVLRPALTYTQRTTISPAFIEDMLTDVILFAVGSNKCDNILNYMHNKNFKHYQIPALIPAQHPKSILFTDCETLL